VVIDPANRQMEPGMLKRQKRWIVTNVRWDESLERVELPLKGIHPAGIVGRRRPVGHTQPANDEGDADQQDEEAFIETNDWWLVVSGT